MTHTPSGTAASPIAIILAAGKGTRMQSDLPKVVHPVGGRPMVCAVVDACLAVGCRRVIAVVGHQQEKVRDALASYGSAVSYAVQDQQLGTGHAVMAARVQAMPPRAGDSGECLVLCGDGPLIRPQTLSTMLQTHRAARADATLATSVIADATGYGRIARDGSGRFQRIVEHRDATEAQLAIREVNPSYYLFQTAALFDALSGVKRQESSGEYYLVDVFELMLGSRKRVEVIEAVPPEDVLSINTPEQLAQVDAIYRARQAGAGSSAPACGCGMTSGGCG